MSGRIRSNGSAPADQGFVKSRIAGAILASIVIIVFVLANLPYQYVQSEHEWIGYLEVAEGGGYQVYRDLPVMAGWPMRYWIRYEDGENFQDRLWLPSRLVMNYGLGLLMAVGVYLFFQIRHRKLIEFPNSHFLRYFFDCSVALAVLAVPGTIFGWQYWQTSHDRQLAKRVAQVGSISLSCWFPKLLDPHIPAGLKHHFVRIREVHVYSVDQEVIERIASLPGLYAFHSYASQYDARPLRQLAKHPHLSVLQVSRQELTDDHVDAISEFRWLRQLRLSYTNLNSTQLKKFDSMKLKLVDIGFTDIMLDQIGKPGWYSTVEVFCLSRPPDGIEASLVIEGWPSLRELRVERHSNLMNEAVISIRLSDLPYLERLCIERVQKHDLVLKDVPRLHRVNEDIADLRFILSSDTDLPGLTWVRSLEIDGADSLKEFGCFARDLEHMSIRRAKGLRRFALGSFYTTLLGEITPLGVDAQRCQGWVNQMGQSQGPSEIDFSYLPLHGADLSALGGNEGIRHLKLGGTGVSFDQVQKLEGMHQLESLNIRSTPLKLENLAWLLDRFPKIEDLTTDIREVSHFDLRGYEQLRELRITSMDAIEELRVSDLPELRTSIRMTQSPAVMDIVNVPGLRGVAVEGPWPPNTNFRGLRDLEWFTGGGDGITDDVANEVLNCDSLDRLTFAYPAVSKEVLRRIGNLKELTFLALPGASVDDDLIEDWQPLTALWEVNLSDTKISVKTIAWLSRMESLRRLAINHVPLDEAAIDALAELTQVSELHLVGVSMPAEKLRPLLMQGSLESLDLSGWEFNEALVDTICTYGKHLKHLVVGDSRLDEASFKRMMAATKNMFLEMNSLPEYADGPTVAELHRRAEVLRVDMNAGWRLMLRPRDYVFQTMPWHERSPLVRDTGPSDGMPKLPATYTSRLDRQLFSGQPSRSN